MLSKEAQQRISDYEQELQIVRDATQGAPPEDPLPDKAGFQKMCGLDIEPEEFAWFKYNMVWGTYGPKGDGPLKWVKLSECSSEHLEAILLTMNTLPSLQKKVILSLLKERWGVS